MLNSSNTAYTFLLADVARRPGLGDPPPPAPARYETVLSAAIAGESGRIVRTSGAAVWAAFSTIPAAVRAATTVQRALHSDDESDLPVRMALHSGPAEAHNGTYDGPALAHLSSLLAAGHGGQILVSQAILTTMATTPPAGVFLQDLGRHRLKDLAPPERIAQLTVPGVPADFPPLQSLDAFSHNLPVQLTSFVGREAELAALHERLTGAVGPQRLLTLIGPGGTGKTRLTLHVAAEHLAAFADGAWLVELAPLADPALLPQAVAAVLGVREEPSRPLTETLAAALQSRHLLLVLDNCEHLVAAAADLAETLLRACPRLVIIASSREALGVSGEIVYRVPSLAQPEAPPPGATGSAAAVGDYAAVRLFLDRARAVRPDLALTAGNAAALATICRRLDGIPLALELAAAQAGTLAVEQIAARLDDRFRLLTGGSRAALPRQQTLRALIDWSWDLLTPGEQRLVARLAVFVGGWTLEAAQAVCADADLPEAAIPDLLTQLVNKSLVVLDEQDGAARYRFLETIRQYAREKLLAAGDAARFHDRHRDWFVEWAARVAPGIERSYDISGFAPMDAELDNLRAALAWAGEGAAPVALARLVVALGWFWENRGYLSEGTQWTQQALAVPDLPLRLRAQVGFTAGRMAFRRQEPMRGIPVMTETVALFRTLDDRLWTAHSLLVLGAIHGHHGDPTRPDAWFAESLDLFRVVDDLPGQARALNHLGERQRFRGNLDAAVVLYNESLALGRALGDGLGIAIVLVNLGHVATRQGALPEAVRYYAEALLLLQSLGYRLMVAEALEGRATLAGVAGEPLLAARLFGAAATARAVLGMPLSPAERQTYDLAVAAAQADTDPTAWTATWAEGATLSLDQAIALACEARNEE